MKRILIVGAGGQDRLRADDISARPVRECQRRGGRCPRVSRAERDGAVRRAERTRSACLRLYGQQVQGRYDFQPGRAAERRGRKRPSAGLEYQHGGADELARHSPPVRLLVVHSQLDRRVRLVVAQGAYASGYADATEYDLRRLQGHGRAAERLLSQQVRGRYAQRPFPGHHLERYAAGRGARRTMPSRFSTMR